MNKFKGYLEKQKTPGYITNKQKFQLAFPQMPLAISNGLIHSAYIKVYTDIIGLDIKYVGIIWMLFSIWNAINDPLMGVFIDRFRYKPQRGKYTYLLKVTAPVTVLSSAAMLYAQPDWPTWVVFGFLTVLLFIYDTTQTGYAIAYSNYILIAAPTSDERVDVSVVTMYAGQIGAFLSMIIPTLLLVGDVDRDACDHLVYRCDCIEFTALLFCIEAVERTSRYVQGYSYRRGKACGAIETGCQVPDQVPLVYFLSDLSGHRSGRNSNTIHAAPLYG